jgi:3-methyladenine DNA glycosylase/8-oxoguanine DNA glycosylase
MVVIAITEQQLSLAAAFYIRGRLVARFGEPFGTLWIFPAPETLAKAPLGELMRCGLSVLTSALGGRVGVAASPETGATRARP